VVDMGITLEQKNLALFDMADHIIIVEKTDELSLRKMNCFYAQYHIMQEYQAKMSRIINFDYGISEKVNCALPLLGRIGNVQNMSASNLIAVLANSTKNEFIMSVFDD
jgi:recombinational DNA repair protein RecR